MVDHGTYYELKGQELYNYKLYDTKKEAQASKAYKSHHREIKKLPNGKYLVYRDRVGDDYEVTTVYSGPIYLDKNVLIHYDSHFGSATGSYCTLEQYFALAGIISGTQPGHIWGTVEQIDQNGYVTVIRLSQAG